MFELSASEIFVVRDNSPVYAFLKGANRYRSLCAKITTYRGRASDRTGVKFWHAANATKLMGYVHRLWTETRSLLRSKSPMIG